MKIYNTLTQKKEEFVPIEQGKVRMYVCGPTVYNFAHIGNARPAIVFDTFRRYLEYLGYQVNYVMNFTDVDDRIIQKSKEEGVTANEISERYIKEFQTDMKALNIREATVHPRATREIDGMIAMVGTLIQKGYAYEKNGTVYFRTRSFQDYGKLSKKKLDELEAGARIAVSEEKEDPMDFVLWKPKKEGEPFWTSPWSDGRPGWHIECSVMSKKYLGDQIDIHAGGEDLIFPHHENEIAQSEAANGKEFARYWMHNAFINIDNKKMSKSEGNFFTIREICEQYDPQVMRFFLLNSHYRSPLNFSRELMEAAKSSLARILTAVSQLEYLLSSEAANSEDAAGSVTGENSTIGSTAEVSATERGITADSEKSVIHAANVNVTPDEGKSTVRKASITADEEQVLAEADQLEDKFKAALDDDFNTADAIAAIFELVKLANTSCGSGSTKTFLRGMRDKLVTLCDILGIITQRKEEMLDEEVEKLIEERRLARKNKDYARSDEIRDLLLARGIILEDTREGVRWKRS